MCGYRVYCMRVGGVWVGEWAHVRMSVLVCPFLGSTFHTKHSHTPQSVSLCTVSQLYSFIDALTVFECSIRTYFTNRTQFSSQRHMSSGITLSSPPPKFLQAYHVTYSSPVLMSIRRCHFYMGHLAQVSRPSLPHRPPPNGHL